MKQHRNRRASLLYLFYTFQPFCEFLLKRKSELFHWKKLIFGTE